MNAEKRRRLEADGWKVGTAAEFLGLTPDEAALHEALLASEEDLKAGRLIDADEVLEILRKPTR